MAIWEAEAASPSSRRRATDDNWWHLYQSHNTQFRRFGVPSYIYSYVRLPKRCCNSRPGLAHSLALWHRESFLPLFEDEDTGYGMSHRQLCSHLISASSRIVQRSAVGSFTVPVTRTGGRCKLLWTRRLSLKTDLGNMHSFHVPIGVIALCTCRLMIL